MRHRRKGRILGRNPSHQRALLKSLACALFLTERDAEFDDNKPKTKGRIITTITKAKEVRPLVEKCITLACRAHVAADAAGEFGTTAARAVSNPGPPNTRSRSAPTSDIGAPGCHWLAASMSDRSSSGFIAALSRRSAKSGSGLGEVNEKS